VDHALVQKRFQGAIDGYPVVLARNLLLDIGVGKRMLLIDEQLENVASATGRPKLKIVQNLLLRFAHSAISN
jgi:hypothetical protein